MGGAGEFLRRDRFLKYRKAVDVGELLRQLVSIRASESLIYPNYVLHEGAISQFAQFLPSLFPGVA